MKKSLKVVSLILLVLFIVAPVHAAGFAHVAPAPASGWEVVAEFAKLIGALIVLGLSNERGVELLKTFWNFLTAKWGWLSLKNKATFVFAAAVSFFAVYYFGIDVTKYLSVLDGFDPQLLQIVNALLLTLVSNYAHGKIKALSS